MEANCVTSSHLNDPDYLDYYTIPLDWNFFLNYAVTTWVLFQQYVNVKPEKKSALSITEIICEVTTHHYDMHNRIIRPKNTKRQK